MGLDNNDSTIRDLKANLCDFFCQKIRELPEIEDASKKDEYIACLIKVAENADNLSESFEQFELLGIPIKILDISSKKQEVMKKDTSEIEEEREEKANNSDAISETVINASDLNVSENKQVIPMHVKKEVVPDEKSKSVLAPSIRVEAPVLPKMPNIFEGIFNNTRSTDTVDSGTDAIEERAPLVNGEQQEMTQKPIVDMPSVSEKKELDLERPMTTQKVVSNNDQVVSIPRVDTVINSNNNVSNSPISSLLAAYTNGPVGVNESIQNNETNLGNRTRIVKLSSDKVKAILVNKSQMEKLAASLYGQRRLLDFGQDAVMPKQNNIEEMMNRAKQLYNEGKQKEAQQLYDEISQINRANTLVKKAG
ncbi:unknown [Mycoplasma sp. CAG:877]|nr:unknown [Mycoplasma sp. CAG:877]